MKILLVENSKTARAVLRRLLENEGYQIETVSTGYEAIHALEDHHYDLLLMDVFMPEMNGYEATKQIRKMGSYKANTPIIAFSGSTNERDRRICLDSGMNEFIPKTDNDQLLATLKKYHEQIDPAS